MRVISLFISLILLYGCAKSWHLGEWTVTDVAFPAVSALSYEEAREWFDSEAIYSESVFSFREERCESPQLKHESLTASEFYSAYRTTFGRLGIEGESANLLHITCADASFFPGSTLIKATTDIVYLPWDGAFFRLDKNTP